MKYPASLKSLFNFFKPSYLASRAEDFFESVVGFSPEDRVNEISYENRVTELALAGILEANRQKAQQEDWEKTM